MIKNWCETFALKLSSIENKIKLFKIHSSCNPSAQILEIVRGKFDVIFNQTSDDGKIKEKGIRNIIQRIIILRFLLTFAVLNFYLFEFLYQ